MNYKSLIQQNSIKIFILIILFIGSISENVHSQETDTTNKVDYSKQVDLKDLFRKLFHKPKDTLQVIDSNKTSISLLPGISYNPANGLIIGAVASISKYFGSPKNTNLSSLAASFSYTTKKQIRLSAQSNLYLKENAWSLQGDWRLWKYSQETYGLGTQTIPDDAQNMTFYFVRFNENVLKKVIKNCYLGVGYSLDYYYKITTINDSDNFLYPNYNNTYSAARGYDSTKYLSSGFVVNIDYDSRDNTINTYKGILADVKYYNYREFLGSSQNWQQLAYDFRAFHPLTKDDSYILAFWSLGNFVVSGKGPYMNLPATGWDKYNTSGRGYIQGRFRGENFLYAGFANRIRLTSNGLFGIVFFCEC
jgi:outer membrane protein assembly factor BamA